ncbi:O-antigen ligase family protein [Patescibacteria group bacterium]|nr:O-antigen ligase family protein [Patescibacteria group bacterium]MBU4579931.1 O-antigen ligase family protein [Patescibacteria group bacterium]
MDFLLQNLVIFLVLVIFVHFSRKKIETGIYAVVFCLPLYLIRLNVFGIPSTALESGIYILFIIWLAKNYRQIKSVEIIPDKSLRLGIILLLVGVLISTFFSSELKTSAGILKGWFVDPFLFFIILVSEIKTLTQRKNILKAFFFSGAAVAAVSLFYWFGFLSNGVSFDSRLHSFYLSPNYLAMYLSPALIVGIWLIYRTLGIDFFKEKNIRENFFLSAISFIIIAVALYFTYSYAAWIAVFAAVILFFYLLTKKTPDFHWKSGVQAGVQYDKKFSLQKKTFLFAAVILFFIALFLTQAGTGKFDNLKNLSYRSSLNSRLMIWRSAWEIGKDNWLIGIGPGNFQKYYLDYQARFTEPYLEWAVPQPHNIFLAFWLETGILGLLGFLVILAWFFKCSLSLLKSNLLRRENFLLVAVLFSIMAYTIMHGLFDTTYWKNDLAIIFWLNLALLASIKK